MASEQKLSFGELARRPFRKSAMPDSIFSHGGLLDGDCSLPSAVAYSSEDVLEFVEMEDECLLL